MPTINYRSTQIKLNVPAKVLEVNMTSISSYGFWDYANGDDDPWYNGSPYRVPNQWTITFSVSEVEHGSHLTRQPYKYNGLDITVGDWIAGSTTGISAKIISVLSKSATSVTCIVEDWLRYNTFQSSTGAGMFDTGPAIVFTLNEDGNPMIDPLPTSVGARFYGTVMSRFQYLNPQLNYPLEQISHGFSKGDVIAVTNAGFVKANSDTMDRMIGTVVEAGPGPNYFMISPNNRIIDFDPKIPGSQGDYIYVQDDGTLGTTDTGKAAFLNLQNAIPTVLIGDLDNPILTANSTMELNFVTVTFSSNTANANITDIVSSINSDTANHNVVANTIIVGTEVESDSSSVAYGQIGGFVPFSAYVDSGSGNTLINFTTATAGLAAYGIAVAIPEDMAYDINSANIANLSASYSTTVSLTLTEENGNAVYIYNGNSDVNNKPFVGVSNISGLPASTAAPNSYRLKLTRSDGGEILIFQTSDEFRLNTGIASGHTGMYPLAMNIEQGLRVAGTSVVADISARNALTAEAGDQAYVLNKGDGEWGLYVYNGSSWTMVSNADSATTDAKTLTTTFTMPVGGFGTATTQLLGNISPSRRILNVVVDVTTAFTGHSSIPNIQVGTLADPDAYVPSTSNDLSESTQFEYSPNYTHPSTETQDLEVRARCTHYGATAGNVTVKLTYV